ncbi:hypothetical protein BJX70DRAFT_402871 [Aspergillus crustosus]
MSSLPGHRSHRKSKAGCLQCKRRKVKCDEGKPTCDKCTIHGVSCSFSSSLLQAFESNAPRPLSRERAISLPEPTPQSTPLLSPTPPLPPHPALNISDLELLHHNTTKNATPSRASQQSKPSGATKSPKSASPCPSLLAVSALHLAHSTRDPSKRASYTSQAESHHNAGMRAVIPSMQFESLASTNGPAVFLFSSLTSIYLCATIDNGLPPPLNSSSSSSPSSSPSSSLSFTGPLAEWLGLFRGTKALSPRFLNGRHLSEVRRSPQVLQEGQMYIWELKRGIAQQHPPASASHLYEIYTEAADQIARTLAVTLHPDYILDTAYVFAWLIEVWDKYLELLREERPTALVIFAYFCVAVKQIEWAWWTDGLSKRLMGRVWRALPEREMVGVRWPVEMMGWNPDEVV